MRLGIQSQVVGVGMSLGDLEGHAEFKSGSWKCQLRQEAPAWLTDEDTISS